MQRDQVLLVYQWCVGGVDNGGGCACVRAGGMWEISVSSNCSVSLKLLPPKKLNKKKLCQVKEARQRKT